MPRWAGDDAATAHTDAALHAARASGNPRALSYALTASSIVASDDRRPVAALALATEAVDQALAARDWWAFVHAVNWETNASIAPLSKQEAEHFRRRREQLAAAGAPHSSLARLAAIEARAWLIVGDWRAAQALLRVTLGSDPGPFADIMTRLTAALFAAWQDRPAEAIAQMERADELVIGDPHGYLNFAFDVVRSFVSLEAGRAEAGYQAAMAGLQFRQAHRPICVSSWCRWPSARWPIRPKRRATLERRTQRYLASSDPSRTGFPTSSPTPVSPPR